MWNLGKRDIIVLVSVISGCAFLFNVWGPFYAITVILTLIICAWFIIAVANDTPYTLYAQPVLDYLQPARREINAIIQNVCHNIYVRLASIVDTTKCLYRLYIVETMAQRRRSTYQLSEENYSSSVNSRLGLIAGLSPIVRRTVSSTPNGSNLENNPYSDGNSRILERSSSMSKITSTPMVPWKKEEVRNGDIFGSEHLVTSRTPWGKSESSPQNHTLSRGDDATYSTRGSPWGTSISPKMRAKAGGVKTVQTVAGPLLASTRYNIDPQLYADVTSPGLTSRLTKYASEANAKLTHQSQYGTGQFPRVNLNASPTPMINAKTGKMRMPVTVRVAPPENTRYSPPERQKILSNIRHPEPKTSPSVVQVLKEISLKRHASQEDVTSDLAKKQRTEGVYSNGLSSLEEMTQKRARDDSSRSEEEISPRNKSLRPAKRTKMPSCHDILSSLSSSINVSSGIKRKAIDTSRSGTPDVGKHFKSLDSSHGDAVNATATSRLIVEQTRTNKRGLNDSDGSRSSDICSPNKKWSTAVVQKGLQKSQSGKQIVEIERDEHYDNPIPLGDERDVKIVRENVVGRSQVAVKLTDRLFMKAEPQSIEKLKTLIEEHGMTKPRFLTNESDEIKKSDIVNMRQTSMKTRLKSMFDAISGKAPSSINPEVVIQAEEAKSSTASTITASLNSSTSTTNVNTSPIAIPAIVPIIGKTKPNTTPAKHVRFQFSTSDSNVKTDNNEPIKVPVIETKTFENVAEPKQSTKIENPVVDEKSVATTTASIFQSFNRSTTTTAAPSASSPAFSFGSPSSNAIKPATTTTPKPSPAVAPMSSVGVSSTATVVATTSSSLFNTAQLFNVTTVSSPVSQMTTPTVAKPDTTTSPNLTDASQASAKMPQLPAVNFSFGSPSTTVATTSASQSAIFASTTGQTFAAPATASPTFVTSSLFGIPNKTTPTVAVFGSSTVNSFSSTPIPATTAAFSFGSNATSQTTEKKAFTFGSTTGPASQTPTTTGTTESSQVAATPVVVAPTTTTTGFSFSTTNAAPSANNSLFGTPATTSSAPSTGFSSSTSTPSLFSFGANAAAPPKPTFAFPSSTTAAPAAMSSTAPISISFGSSSNNTSTAMFGAPSATPATTTTAAAALPSLFGTPATSTVGFSTATTTPSTFGTTSGQSSFAGTGNPSTGFGPAKIMETPTFGSTTVAPPSFAASSTAANLFSGGIGANPTSTAVPTTAAPAFGSSHFGETKPPPPAFGTNPSSTFSGTSGTSLFGSQPAGNTTFGASNTSTNGSTALFGNANASGQTFGANAPSGPTFGAPTTAPPPFGATNTAITTFGAPATSATSFGTVSSSAPSFGLQTSNPATSGHSSSATTGFGAATTTAPPPAFGATVSTTSGFGNSATSGFGNPVNQPPAFSSTNTGFSGFGTNASSPFGSQPASGGLTFGASSSSAPAFGVATANNSGSFTFGANQPVAQQPQQSASFAFGTAIPAAGNNSAGTSAPFQFGNSAPPTGGFNFSGVPSAPAVNFSRDANSSGSFAAPAPGANAFNAPNTGGMFSIGSGTTGPRSRPSRRRQR